MLEPCRSGSQLQSVASPTTEMGDGPGESPMTVTGRPGAVVRLAGCCTPVPPDEVTGFVIRGGAVAVHRSGCPDGEQMRAAGRGPLQLGWAPGAGPRPGYRVTLRAEALNRPRLLADLTAAMSGEGIGIVSAEVEPPQELRVRHTYTVELPEAGTLPAVMRAMLRVSGVYDVFRPGPPDGNGAGRNGARGNGDDHARRGMGPSRGMHGRSAAFTGGIGAGVDRDPQG